MPGRAKGFSESESGDAEATPQGTSLLRQLRGGTRPEQVTRQPELQRRTTTGRHEHNVYRSTKVTSRAQEEQSAMPAGVRSVWEGSDDEAWDGGWDKEMQAEAQALRVAKYWRSDNEAEIPSRGAAAEAMAIGAGDVEVDLRQPQGKDGTPLSWDDVRRMLDAGQGAGRTDSEPDRKLDKAAVHRDYDLKALGPTQLAFAKRILQWGGQAVQVYTRSSQLKPGAKLKRMPLLRCFLGGSDASGKSTTLRTVLQHLRLKFQEARIEAEVELTAYTGVAAFNIGLGEKTACSAFDIYPEARCKKEPEADRSRALEER